MSDRPTIHLTNWSSPKFHGPGRKWTIMARPRAWEHGDGQVRNLMPPLHLLRAVKDGSITVGAYFAELEREWARSASLLAPGLLRWVSRDMGIDVDAGDVEDGDTLCCACARGAPCHRRAAAPFLVRAGWRVILDGVEVTE